MRIKSQVHDPDHPSVVTSLGNLATAYRRQGQFEQAERTYQDALERSRRRLGEEHLSTLTLRLNLGVLHANDERFAEAAQELELVRASLLRGFGPEEPRTLSATYNLARCLVELSHTEEAVALLEPMVPEGDGLFELDDSAPAYNRLVLGRALAATGDPERAREFLLEAHDRFAQLADLKPLARTRRALVELLESQDLAEQADEFRDP